MLLVGSSPKQGLYQPLSKALVVVHFDYKWWQEYHGCQNNANFSSSSSIVVIIIIIICH